MSDERAFPIVTIPENKEQNGEEISKEDTEEEQEESLGLQQMERMDGRARTNQFWEEPVSEGARLLAVYTQ